MPALCCYSKVVQWLPKRAPNHSAKLAEPVPHAPPHNWPRTPPTALQNGSLDCGSKLRPRGMLAATIQGQNAARVWRPLCGQTVGQKVARAARLKVSPKYGIFKYSARPSKKLGPLFGHRSGHIVAIFFFNVSPIVSPMSDWRASTSGRILARSLEPSGASFGRPSQGCFRGHLETRLESNLEGSVGWIWELYEALSGH